MIASIRTLRALCVWLLIFVAVRAEQSISIDEFTKLSTEDREKAIKEAPEEEKGKLIHLYLLQVAGSEGMIVKLREGRAMIDRSSDIIEEAFFHYVTVFEGYQENVLERLKRAGMSNEKRLALYTAFSNGWKTKEQQRNQVSTLLFNAAPSKALMELEKKADKLDADLLQLDSDLPGVTADQVEDMDERIDEVFKELLSLPKLSPAQRQQALDHYSEKDLFDYITDPVQISKGLSIPRRVYDGR